MGGWEVQGEGMYVYKQLIHLAAETDNTVKQLYSNLKKKMEVGRPVRRLLPQAKERR